VTDGEILWKLGLEYAEGLWSDVRLSVA
jgi:hypothetical protein